MPDATAEPAEAGNSSTPKPSERIFFAMAFAEVLLARSRERDKVSVAKLTLTPDRPDMRSRAVSIFPTQLAQSMPSTWKLSRSAPGEAGAINLAVIEVSFPVGAFGCVELSG